MKTEKEWKGLRPQKEAFPLPWYELTKEQQAAGDRVLRLLKGMLEETPKSEHQISGPLEIMLPRIRQDHWNNVVLIDGSRGSGKTSLMATILDGLKSLVRPKPGEALPIGFPPFEGIVLPVAFLDLHPLPPSTNLLLHLVSRLEGVVRALEEASPVFKKGGQEAPWKSSGGRVLESRERWKQLSQSVATSWNGNLEQRAGALDPDFYAWELTRTESYRQEITSIFRSFVDTLVRDVEASHLLPNSPAFFLIALDDVDLVPDRSADVLDLLRKLWHPRVAFLLTGDSEQMLAILRNHFLGMLLRPVASLQLSESYWMEDDLTRSSSLAVSTLEKIIPSPHRCRIGEASREEKLEKLGATLREFKVESEAASLEMDKANNLFYFFKSETHASEALPSQLRSLLSLKEQLDELSADKEKPNHHGEIAKFVVQRWRDLILQEPLPGGQRELREVVRLDEKDQLVVDHRFVEFRFNGRTVWEIPTADGRRIGVMSIKELVPYRVGTRQSLPDSLNGLLRLATDLVADIRDYHFWERSPAPSGFLLDPVIVTWDLRWEPEFVNGFTWPMPDWEGFLSTNLFADEWNKMVLGLTLEKVNPGELARDFLQMIETLAHKREAHSLIGKKLPTWQELAKRMAALTNLPGGSVRQRQIAAWARGRAGLLAAPEAGLPDHEANSWLTALQTAFGEKWDSVRVALRSERRQQIKLRSEVPTLEGSRVALALDTIDRTTRKFMWKTEVEKRTSAEKTAIRYLQARAENPSEEG